MHLGIDLGTSNSAVASNVNSQIRICKTSDGSDVLPSVIYIDRRGHRLYGKRAYEQTVLSPENVATGFKRLMGTSTPIEFKASAQTMTPEECSAEILRQLISQVTLETSASEIIGVAITIPAAFNQMQSEATLRAANAAGLEQVILLQEPIAASMAAMAQAKNRSGQFLVYDLGGGTFDLALVQSLSGSVNIIGHEGINMLGGRDFDRVIVNSFIRPWLVDKFSLPQDFQKTDRYRRLIGKAIIAAETAKIDLSTADKVTIFQSDEDIQVKDEAGADIYVDIPITRSAFETCIEPELLQTVELTRSIIRANGYGNHDIDRIVFVGGPSKMPWVRERVPRELGIPSDASIDPMTAVAIGAAMYAESREWTARTTKRKAIRASTVATGDIGIKFDYPARTTHDVVKLRLKVDAKAVAARLAIQVDDLDYGWTSGRVAVAYDVSVELPARELGEHRYRIAVFDEAGLPIPDAGNTLSIVRTYATAAAIPATQTISIKVRAGVTSVRNVLQPLILKGTPLPAKGSSTLLAAYSIGSGLPGHIDLELFQDENASDPNLNLFVGSFRITQSDLPEDRRLNEGDKVIFHWAMDESGLLTAAVELPSLQQTFSTKRFYVDQAGHRSFEGEAGERLVADTIKAAEAEAATIVQALGTGSNEMTEIESRLEVQRRKLAEASSGDERRSITETVRRIRQATARVRSNPDHRGRYLEHRVMDLVRRYDEYARPKGTKAQSEKFDQQSISASNEIKRRSPSALDAAETILDQMEAIYWQTLWQQPEFVVAIFKEETGKRHLAADKAAFDLLVADGENAIKVEDMVELRTVIRRLWDNQIATASVDGDAARLASVLRS